MGTMEAGEVEEKFKRWQNRKMENYSDNHKLKTNMDQTAKDMSQKETDNR